MNKQLYFLILSVLFLLCVCKYVNASPTQIVDGGEYYIYNIYYDCILGHKADGVTPGLSNVNTNADTSYIFVAEASGDDNYFLLRQKSSEKYLAASSSNDWNVIFESARSNTDRYLWTFISGRDARLSCKKSSALYLGCDAGNETMDYVSVFYNKTLNDLSRWEIIEVSNNFETSRKQLYIDELSQSITSGKRMLEQESYSDNWRQHVTLAVTDAEDVYNNATTSTLNLIIETTDMLRQVLIDCRISDMRTLLSGADFDVGDSFTLAMNDLRLVSENSSFSVLVRNSKGNGAIIEIEEGRSVIVEGKIITESSFSSSNQASNYQFSFAGPVVNIYRDGALLGSASTYSVPSYTANKTAAEWAILSESTLDKYMPEIISATKAVAQGTPVVDQYGNASRYAIFLKNLQLDLSDPVDFHLLKPDSFLINSSINLTHKDAWIILDNTLPSEVIKHYLTSFKINGQEAVVGHNVRVAIYLNGAIIMPEISSITPFVGYTNEQYAGEAISLPLGANELGEVSNSFESFTLQRGYMAILASGFNGSGYSRVYVADHQDINVSLLPNSLNRRISSVHIKRWNYVSKKGWCSTTSSSAIATECNKVRATWFYTWSADRSSTYDTEYIPIWTHLNWPSMSQIASNTNSTHVLGFNEPEHEEQHTDGTISAWTACTKTPELQSTGMRIGSPSPTDASWLTEYIGYCDNMAYRCDFVAIHSYWGTNEAYNATAWYNRLKAVYDATKRPIWITEWNNGASWTTENWPSSYGDKLEKNRIAIKEITEMLDTCSFIERYSIYNWDSYYRAMIANDGWVTPAGQVYRDNASTFAYHAKTQFIPKWWAPALKTVDLEIKINAVSKKIQFSINNNNGDMTDQLSIQRKNIDGTFEDYYVESNRSVFDKSSYNYLFDLADFDIENDEFRLCVTTLSGEETISATVGAGYIVNPNIVTNNQTVIDGWTCLKSASNGFTKGTGNTYLEIWNSDPKHVYFDYYQDITNLINGVYKLSAACFNSSNGVVNAMVNGHVGLYAQSDGVEYFTSINEDAELDLAKRQTIPYIVVTDRTLRIGIKNIGTMTARWAGADEFKLEYLGASSDILPQGNDVFKKEIREQSDKRYKALFIWDEDSLIADASPILINPDCHRKDTYGWTANTVEYATEESFNANIENNYWNKWSSSAFSSEMYQDLNFLPVGDYTASMLFRCSTGTEMTFYMSLDGGKTKEALKTVEGNGDVSPSGSVYSNGWQKVTLPTIALQKGESLRIGFLINATNKWWSTDHFTISYSSPVTDAIYEHDYFQSEKGVRITAQAGELKISTLIPTDITVYSMTGILVVKKRVGVGETRISLPSGIYVVNRQLFVL